MADPRFTPLERRIGPIRYHDISYEELTSYMAEPADRVRMVACVNLHAVNLAMKDPAFLDALHQADVVYCDGYGVKLCSLLLGWGPIRHRLTGPDFLDDLFGRIARRGGTAFLAADDPGVAERYAARFREAHPGLIVGIEDGYFYRYPDREASVLGSLRSLRPDFVALGMGMPRQEKWIVSHAAELPPAMYFGIGAAFAWMTGNRRRGPAWMVNNGLEWFFRLLSEPHRVWRRYLVGLPEAGLRLAAYRLRELFLRRP